MSKHDFIPGVTDAGPARAAQGGYCSDTDGHDPWECPAAQVRFWAYTEKRGEGECWPWIGGHGGRDYGRIMVHGRHYSSQVFAWMLANGGPFPEGMKGCHSCDNPLCVNPAHVWPGTQQQNVQDALIKGRLCGAKFRAAGTAKLLSLTHCRHGHEFTPENTALSNRGWRSCRICARLKTKNQREARRAHKA